MQKKKSQNWQKADRIVAQLKQKPYPLLGLAVAGATAWIGALAWRTYAAKDDQFDHATAFASNETDPDTIVQTRSAGPEAMRDHPGDDWDKIDQAADESFPASDPMGV